MELHKRVKQRLRVTPRLTMYHNGPKVGARAPRPANREGGDDMARIKHIALSTDDPAKTADFYKQVFGLTELRREPAETGADGIWLSDGYIYFAILKHGCEDTPHLGEGASTVNGV